MENDTVIINGVPYVREDSLPKVDGEYVLVRSREAGVFVGCLVSRDGAEVELSDARRIWYWSGAASLSQLAVDGTSKPKECKFPAPVPSITVLGVCEVIPVTNKALLSIKGVAPWRQ